MKKPRNLSLLAFCSALSMAVMLVFSGRAIGGDLEPSGPPGSTMHTLEEIYNTLVTGLGGLAPVEKTGQTTMYETGDDGDLEKGVPWPNPRFTDNADGTVTDNLTGLVWLKNANCFGQRTWSQALSDCNSLASGSCGLTDGSSAGNWRLPNVKELQSLLDYGRYNPALPSGHPFTDVQSMVYWSSTTYAGYTGSAWGVNMELCNVNGGGKTDGNYYVWPVRGGN